MEFDDEHAAELAENKKIIKDGIYSTKDFLIMMKEKYLINLLKASKRSKTFTIIFSFQILVYKY